jgi:hypothetical protein
MKTCRNVRYACAIVEVPNRVPNSERAHDLGRTKARTNAIYAVRRLETWGDVRGRRLMDNVES